MADLFEQKYPNNIRTISGLANIPFQDDVVLQCDTTLGPVSINLLGIPQGKWSTQFKLYIIDTGNNAAANNITVNAPVGFKINGAASSIINANGASLIVRVGSDTNYVGLYSVTAGGTPFAGIPVKNTVYVSKSGSDVTGLIERLDKPFLTISAAITASVTGFPAKDVNNRVRIVVESGLYTENVNLQSYIDFDLGDSVIDGYISDNNVDFGAIADGLWHCIIYGVAQLKKMSVSGAFNQSFILFKSNNNVLINCDSISSDVNDAVAMIGGYAKIICNNILGKELTSTSRNAINMAVDNASTRCVLEVVGANIETFTGGNSPAIDFAGTVAQTLKLIDCTVRTKINNVGSSAAITSGRTSISTGGILYLYNTTLYSLNGAGIQVNNACNLTLYGIHSNIANAATLLVGTGALTPFINPLTIDVNLPY